MVKDDLAAIGPQPLPLLPRQARQGEGQAVLSTVTAKDFSLNRIAASFQQSADAGDVHPVAGLEVYLLKIGGDKGEHTPVDHIGAVAFCGILPSKIGASAQHALARGAKIYGEMVGYGATCDAYHITSPDIEGRGLAQCLRRTMEDAGVKPEEVDYINAHGTSTPYNDKFETAAIRKVFGEAADKLMVSSIEAAVCAKTIETGIVPPTINYEHKDPDCDLDYVPNVARKADVNVAISTNLGFGGHNGALLFRKFKTA